MVKRNKKVRNATPTSKEGIKFRSRLEAYCYEQLVQAGLEFQYEEYKFTIVDKYTYEHDSYEQLIQKGKRGKVLKLASPNIRAITYTPDFVSFKHKFVIETKGFANESFPLRWKLFKKYLSDNNIDLKLYVPRNQKQVNEVINLIKNNGK